MVKLGDESGFLDAISESIFEPFDICLISQVIFLSSNKINWNVFRNTIEINHWWYLGTVLGPVVFIIAIVELFEFTGDDVLAIMEQLLNRACTMCFRVINNISCWIIIRSIGMEPWHCTLTHAREFSAEPRSFYHTHINLMDVEEVSECDQLLPLSWDASEKWVCWILKTDNGRHCNE